ncbi:helix-turn-helix domain-containing protein [Peribacillus muralis]|uniref:helix-turn-helix domain-containing protein n=1 Tax=Peribacillus muralis TaxID=264697 RepID=UPI003CFCB99F
MIKVTLRAARVNTGLSLIEASKIFGINKDTLAKYEKDSSNIPRSIFIQIEEIYKIPVDNIFFGQQSEFFRKFKQTG